MLFLTIKNEKRKTKKEYHGKTKQVPTKYIHFHLRHTRSSHVRRATDIAKVIYCFENIIEVYGMEEKVWHRIKWTANKKLEDFELDVHRRKAVVPIWLERIKPASDEIVDDSVEEELWMAPWIVCSAHHL